MVQLLTMNTTEYSKQSLFILMHCSKIRSDTLPYIWRDRYWVCNDRSHSDARKLHGESGFRDTSGSYIHYRANGTIAPVVIDAVGIGQYDGSRGRIEAENFFEMIGATKLDLLAVGGGDGFAMGGLRVGSVLRFPNVSHRTTTVSLGISSAKTISPGMSRCAAQIFGVQGDVILVLRVATPMSHGSSYRWQLAVYNSTQPGASGIRLGECAIGNAQPVGGISSFEDVECLRLRAGPADGVLNLAFVVEAHQSVEDKPQDEAPAELVRIDSFELVHV